MKLPPELTRKVLEQSTVTGKVNLPRPEPANEAEFQQQVIDYAHSHGWLVAHFRSVKVQTRSGIRYQTPVQADGAGFPDLVMVRERIVYAELKSAKGKHTPAQERWLQVLTDADGEAYLWFPSDWSNIERLLS